MNFKFCTHILSIDQNNSPLKISGAVAGCVVRTLKTFKCTHILGASCGLLCDSYAVLFLTSFCCYWVIEPTIAKSYSEVGEKQFGLNLTSLTSLEVIKSFVIKFTLHCECSSVDSP